MMNKNYRKGRKFECFIVNFFRNKNCYATRTAGSHTLFDVIGIVGKQVFLIQCKTGRFVNKEVEKFKLYGQNFCRNNVHVFFCWRSLRKFKTCYLNEDVWLNKKDFENKIFEIIKKEVRENETGKH